MLDHAEGVASLPTGLAAHFIHERPHEKDAPAADADFAGIQMRHRGQVEGGSLIEEMDFQALGLKETLHLELSVRAVQMGMANDIVDGLVGGQHHGGGGFLIQAANLANRFNEGPGQGHLMQVAGDNQGPGRSRGGHTVSPVSLRCGT